MDGFLDSLLVSGLFPDDPMGFSSRIGSMLHAPVSSLKVRQKVHPARFERLDGDAQLFQNRQR